MAAEDWDGKERRRNNYCPAHIDFFSEVKSDIAVIKSGILEIQKARENETFDFREHVRESVEYRKMIDKHEGEIKSIKGTKALIVGTLISALLSTGGVIWSAGWQAHQVKTDHEKISAIESALDLHRQHTEKANNKGG